MSGIQVNDRIALELGRAVLRAVIAEERASQAEAKLAVADEARAEPAPPP